MLAVLAVVTGVYSITGWVRADGWGQDFANRAMEAHFVESDLHNAEMEYKNAQLDVQLAREEGRRPDLKKVASASAAVDKQIKADLALQKSSQGWWAAVDEKNSEERVFQIVTAGAGLMALVGVLLAVHRKKATPVMA